EEAHRKRKEEQELKSAAGKRMFGAEDVFGGRLIWGMGRITALLVGISVVIWILYQIPSVRPYFGVLSITQQYIGSQSDRWTKGLEEVRRGEVWRLITPIFIHFNLLHIFFNMLWLRDLGTLIELRRGGKYLLLQVVLIGAISNL